ncbi:MAG: 4-diphosphocytidyl-2C-methyl-D-erythritol kinase, partial [Chloroflexota bacterium]
MAGAWDEVAAILLAAGLSTRMGTPKPLLAWDGRTLVEYQVAQLVAAGVGQVVVVTGHAGAEVQRVLAGNMARLG